MRKILTALATMMCLTQAWAAKPAKSVTIKVDTQDAFENVLNSIRDEADKGACDITVSFSSRTFFFNELHFLFSGWNYPNLSLHFVGNHTILKSKGETLKDGEAITSALDQNTGILSGIMDVFPWSNVYQSYGLIQVVDKESKLCRLRCKGLKKRDIVDLDNCYILLTEWYKSDIYRVDEVRDGAIYFKVNDIDTAKGDEIYAKRSPRFKLTNTIHSPVRVSKGKIQLADSLSSVHLCQAGWLLASYGAHFKELTFKDIHFCGNRFDEHALMDFTDVTTNRLEITGCEFSSIRSNVIQVARTDNFSFEGNSIHDCYRSGVTTVYGKGISIKDNTFLNTGLAMNNDWCIWCSSDGFTVSGNSICNFGYAGIEVGMSFRAKTISPIKGVVENNELWYTKDYYDDYLNHTLMDSGAIYAYTQNTRSIIRNNYIHDYIGVKDNRGIFLDDGASNVTVEGNTIERASNCWCIDSRRTPEVEKAADSVVRECNIGNVIRNNKVDGKIRFEQRWTR